MFPCIDFFIVFVCVFVDVICVLFFPFRFCFNVHLPLLVHPPMTISLGFYVFAVLLCLFVGFVCLFVVCLDNWCDSVYVTV